MEASKRLRFYNYIIDLIIIVVTLLLFLFITSMITHVTNDILVLIVIFYPIIYYFLTELKFGQTLAKMITGTIVVTQSGSLPSALAVFARTICRLIPVDNISLIISDRIWHDRFSNTYVVNKKRWLEHFKRDNPDIL